MTKPASRIETNTKFIRDLVTDIATGETKIPQFQRKFVWKHPQALDLLDSILKNYPVGSLLLWRTSKKLATERNIGDFKLPSTEELSPTNYVLDGQQRLTVIYSCLGATDDEGGFVAIYNLIEERFEEINESGPYKFNLRHVFDTTKLLNFRAGLVSHENANELQKRLDKLIDSVHNYKFPVVTLKDLSIEEVGTIFERINSSGTKLSVYDLMVAATWTQNFSLDDRVQEILDSLQVKKFSDIEQNSILKCMSAVHSGSVKKRSIFGLRDLTESQMITLADKTKASLLKSVDLFSNEFNVFGNDFLPYEAQLVIICYIFSKHSSLSHTQLEKIKKWFWLSSFGERYRVGGEGFLTNDLTLIDDYLDDNSTVKPSEFGDIPDADKISKIQFRKNNSRSVAFTLAISLRRPKSVMTGAVVELNQALSLYNQKHFHHFYPKAHLKRENDDDNMNSVANIVMLSASDNIAISDNDPRTYVAELAGQLSVIGDEVFSSNLLPKPSTFSYPDSSFGEFVVERSKIIHEYLLSLVN